MGTNLESERTGSVEVRRILSRVIQELGVQRLSDWAVPQLDVGPPGFNVPNENSLFMIEGVSGSTGAEVNRTERGGGS